MGEQGERTKVAILGGGVGSIVAAFELTRTEELRKRFDVTVYQLGWRLGGKGASGRDRDRGDRILEHGLHVWFGFYDEAWKAMRAAYEELGRPKGAPLRTVDDAFRPCDQIVLYDRQDGEWHAQARNFPRNGQRPGEDHPLPTLVDIGIEITRWANDRFHSRGSRSTPRSLAPASVEIPQDLKADAERIVPESERALQADDLDLLLEATRRVAEGDTAAAGERGISWPDLGVPKWMARALTVIRDGVWETLKGPIRDDPEIRSLFTMLDVAATSFAGIVADDVLGDGFDAVNQHEFCAWLKCHGAKEVTLGKTPADRAPILRSIYDVAFGYPDGVIAKANVAAGTALTDLIRLTFGYRGSVFYKMNAGMGDVVFAPFYEVLSKKRGVKFEFFHGVTDVRLSDDGTQATEIDVVRQAELKNPSKEYQPLYDVEVEGGKLPCWPSEPDWKQLDSQTEHRNFEDESAIEGDKRTLELGKDFDHVVLGISLGSLRGICSDVIEKNDKFATAVEKGVTVRTQAFQLWMNQTAEELGWEYEPDSVAGAYVEPLDTYCDMSHLRPVEHWAGTKAIAYFCAVQEHVEGDTQKAATDRAKADALKFLKENVGPLWPNAVTGGRTGPLDWSLLVGPGDATDEKRFDAQYWRANFAGSERYVLTPAGTVTDRVSPAGFGVHNLLPVGDWTRTGVDGGCVEAAAISGVRAAHTLIGDDHEIPGEDPRWLRRQ